MKYEVPEDFQRKIDDFNNSQGGPSRIAVCWNIEKGRWQVFAVVVDNTSHPSFRSDVIADLFRKFPDHSGRYGVLLFTWCERDSRGTDIGHAPLDDRLFTAIRYCDSFADKKHYENTLEASDRVKDESEKKLLRSIAGAGAEYYKGYDNLSISMNPNTKAGGSWRHRIR